MTCFLCVNWPYPSGCAVSQSASSSNSIFYFFPPSLHLTPRFTVCCILPHNANHSFFENRCFQNLVEISPISCMKPCARNYSNISTLTRGRVVLREKVRLACSFPPAMFQQRYLLFDAPVSPLPTWESLCLISHRRSKLIKSIQQLDTCVGRSPPYFLVNPPSLPPCEGLARSRVSGKPGWTRLPGRSSSTSWRPSRGWRSRPTWCTPIPRPGLNEKFREGLEVTLDALPVPADARCEMDFA